MQPYDPRMMMKLMFYSIVLILVCTYAFANDKVIDVLEKIETGELDQHSGAYEVGNLLKKIYIDGAVMKSENMDKKMNSGKKAKKSVPVKKITWKEYKAMHSE